MSVLLVVTQPCCRGSVGLWPRATPKMKSSAPTAAPRTPARRSVFGFVAARAKEQGIRITGLTSYDVLTAQIFDESGIDFLLVGDSAGNTVFGYDTTLPVTVDALIPLTRAVARQRGGHWSLLTCRSAHTNLGLMRLCAQRFAS